MYQKIQCYDYPTAFSYWGEEEDEAIRRVIRSGQFTCGPEVAAFEREFAAYHGVKHCIMVNSGSSANLIIVAALKELGYIKTGDTALVPAIAWSTTYAPLVQHGLDLALCDVDDTWNLDFYAESFDPQDTKVWVGCSILGNPANLRALKEQADRFGAVLIEDNCESLGASPDDDRVYKPRLCGTYGLMSSSSFFYSHQISAIEGGAILTEDDACADMCRMLRAHGWTRDIRKPQSFDEEYNFEAMGYNVRPVEVHAAIAREQLRKLPKFIEARQHNWMEFEAMVRGLPITMQAPNGDISPFGIPFEVDNPAMRPPLVNALRACGIDCRLPTGGSLRMHTYGVRWQEQETPNADRIHGAGLFLGNAPYDISGKIECAVKVMRQVFAGNYDGTPGSGLRAD